MTDLRFTHIGGPTTLIEFEGWRLLTDPTFDAPGRRYAFGWGTSSHKTAGPAIPADELGRIDAVLLTHDHHADNLDTSGRTLLDDVAVVATTESGAHRLGANARGLAPWDVTTLEHPDRPTIEITATPCRHGPPGSHSIVGDVIGFALRWEGQVRGAFWISGDTVLYHGVREVPSRVDVGTAVVHLGGVRFPITGPIRYTMTAHDAIELCQLLDAHTVIPVHYEGWSHFREGRAAIERELSDAPAEVRERLCLATIGTELAVVV